MGQTASASKEEITWDSDPYYLVCIGVHKSRRYHAKMRGFYEALNRGVLAANAILGAGAFMALFGGRNTTIAQVMIGIVAAGSALDNVFGWAKKAKLHDTLCQRFTDLAAKIAEWDATPNNHRKACAERLRIEKDEPPIRRLIDIQARNEELQSRGYSAEHMAPLSRRQRVVGYVCTFGMATLDRWAADRQRTQVPNDLRPELENPLNSPLPHQTS